MLDKPEEGKRRLRELAESFRGEDYLPKLDGREVVQAIRADPALRHLPVVALSSSGEPNDIDATYACGADSYLQKPVDFMRFIDDVRRLRVRWLER